MLLGPALEILDTRPPVPAPRAPPVVASRTAKYRALSGREGAALLTCPFCPIGFQHFLCYICKEYVEDLAKIPKSFLQEANVTLIVIGQSSYHHIEPFCRLTGYSHEIYVDPEREIYKRLGMKRGEEIASSGQSPHVKSNLLSGSLQSLWRAVTGPLFDFQGDPAQQGGILILGPGNNIHFIHRDRNRLDHKPINSVLQLVGVQHVNFTNRPSVIHV
ncbi:PREDICTED: thioredoxin-like protein AAED1 [Mandrillus leucophaeus]|uniref:thioredoxin-like protein AAED1 n=1 Tax=Mandrillus leucophaeus TaxID=9568 RepID=UPI0005F501F9|nr:PREDICTED: thioredoxin-like protein AAED1 [Mandrillus leucophaeus]